jgi:hypothetical protein
VGQAPGCVPVCVISAACPKTSPFGPYGAICATFRSRRASETSLLCPYWGTCATFRAYGDGSADLWWFDGGSSPLAGRPARERFSGASVSPSDEVSGDAVPLRAGPRRWPVPALPRAALRRVLPESRPGRASRLWPPWRP